MSRARGGSDESAGQLNLTAREADLFTFLDLDTPRDARSCTAALPRQRGHLPVAVALKINCRLDRTRDTGARTGEEAVAIGGKERSNLTGFIERRDLIRA